MKKCDLLALIEACQDKLKSINTDNLSNNAKEKLEKILAITSEHYNIISQANENDVDLFNNYAEMYTRIYYNVLNKETKNLDNNETGLSVYSQLSLRDNNDLIPIEDELVEDQNLENRKKAKTLLKIIAGTGSIMLAIAILATIAKENNKIKNDVDSLDDELGIVQVLENNLDVNNEEALYNYAQSLQELLPENTLTTEDIINCLKLANFDELLNQSVFSSREELYDTISKLGTLVKYAGTEKTVIEILIYIFLKMNLKI